jgi:hypothetical protein
MAKRRTWRWVTREWVTRDSEQISDPCIRIWKLASIPRLETFSSFFFDRQEWTQLDKNGESSDLLDCCYQEFKRALNITIPTDRPVKVEFTARVLED